MTAAEREHWLSITDDPDWRRNYIHDPAISVDETVAVITAAAPPQPGRILELGCGYGRLTREIGRVYPEAVIIGLDINPDVLDVARGYDPRTTFLYDERLSHLSTTLDLIYSVAVFQHLPDGEKQAYIAQASTVLDAGGVLRVQFIAGDRDDHLDHWVPADRMIRWARAAGFADVSVDEGLAHPQWAWLTAVKAAR
ncbi:methyltransferase domain-containing protein [Nocardia nova SH22a]|uniref:Methyltransferase domain-containing protein n=1 Tax=Nocardia nova SH22a TaxID=1415166 RepID=W5TNU6_9NOCA|nr:class I SAM-dependent methyltransferase [Nocardia nova]AHH20834.1 methyltransferase domain-containing protein [Nocardia nova SH22a]